MNATQAEVTLSVSAAGQMLLIKSGKMEKETAGVTQIDPFWLCIIIRSTFIREGEISSGTNQEGLNTKSIRSWERLGILLKKLAPQGPMSIFTIRGKFHL